MSKKQINNRLDKLFDDIKEEERALDPPAPAPIPIGKDVVKEAEVPLETPASEAIPLDTDKIKEEITASETPAPDPIPDGTSLLPPLDDVLASKSKGKPAEIPRIQIDTIDAHATMSLPVRLGAESWATLQISDSNTNRQWGGGEQLLVQQVTDQLSQALENALLFQETQTRAQEMTALADVAREISSTLDLKKVLESIASQAKKTLNAITSAVFVPDESAQTFSAIAAIGAGSDKIKGDTLILGEGIIGNIALTKIGKLVNDTSSDPETRAVPGTKQVENEHIMVAPILSQNELRGLLVIWRTGIGQEFLPSELEFLESLAQQAAIAVDNAQAYERIQQAADEMAMLFDVSQDFSSASVDIYEIGSVVAENFLKALTFSECTISILDPDGKTLRINANSFIDDETGKVSRDDEVGGTESLADFPATARVLENKQPLEIHASDSDADPAELAYMQAQEVNIQSLIILPLAVKGHAIGIVELENWDQELHLSDGELNLAMTLANQAALALDNALSYERIQKAANEMATVFDVSQAISSAPVEIEGISRVVARNFTNVIGIPECSVCLYDSDNHTARVVMDLMVDKNGRQQIREDEIGNIYYLKDYPDTSRALVDFQPLVIHASDPDADPNEVALMKEYDVTTTVVLPLVVKRQTIGYIELESSGEERHFSQEVLNLAMTLANQAAVAIENARLFENTQKRLREQTIIREATEILSSTLEYEAILTQLTKLLCEAIDATTASIIEIDDKLKTYTVTAEYISPDAGGGENQSDLGETYSIADYGDEEIVLLERLQQGQHYVNHIDDPQIGEMKQNEMEQYGAKSILDIPLKSRGELIGFVEIYESRHKREFTDEEINLCVLLSQQAANAIENARLFEETQESEKSLQRQNDYMAAAAEVGRLVTSTLDMDILFRRAVYLLREHFGYYHAAIFTIEEAGFEVVVREATGDAGKEMKERKHSLQVGSKSVVGTATDTGKPFIVNNVADNPNHQPNPLLPDTKAEAAIPLIIGRRIIGALDLQSTDVDAFTPEDVIVLQLLADQFATAIDNARSYKLAQDSFTEMRELERLKSQFLANMSHELRTPLNSIIGFSRIIIKGIDGPVTDLQQQDLTAIYNSGQHLLGLINDILDLSKIEAGKMELTFDEIDVEKLIKSVMSTVVGLIKDKPVRLEEEIQNDLPAVKADSMRVRQILINLFSNAAKFTDEGVIKVTAESEGDFVRISVIDSGPGISKEDQKKLFQAFSQVDASATRATGGSGLGLSISQELVHMHGGEIGLDSEVGKGSTFFFTLPLHEDQEITPEIEIAESQDDAHSQVVLAIDDDEKVIKLYQRYLHTQGYQVIALTDPKKAVESAKEINPYAITLDIMMPNYDGWQVLQDLKSDPETQHIPILVCSIVEDTDKGYALGATDYLLKPIIEEDLLGALDRLNDNGSLQDILIIDDDPDDRRLLEKILNSAKGFTPILAEDGPAGWDMIVSHPPDAVILDLFMPKMDGFEIIDAMQAKAELKEIPVIVISGGDISSTQQEKLDSLNHHLIQKGTLDPKELLSILGRSLNLFKKKE